MIANLFGSTEDKSHDVGMLEESKHRFNSIGKPLCLYGDTAYPLTVHLLGHFKEINLSQKKKDFNSAKSSEREAVEWGFSKVLNYFAFVDFKNNLKTVGKKKCSW